MVRSVQSGLQVKAVRLLKTDLCCYYDGWRARKTGPARRRSALRHAWSDKDNPTYDGPPLLRLQLRGLEAPIAVDTHGPVELVLERLRE